MADRETISVYDQQVDRYSKITKRDAHDPVLLAFIGRVKPGGLVLDLGCGPAQASAAMRDHGLRVDPVDASPEMVRLANETYDIGARIAEFDDIEGSQIYDGVWANFSLLHASADQFPLHLATLHRALKSGGTFHIGMKLGSGTVRDRLGRLYEYYSEEELEKHLTNAGFVIEEKTLGEGMGLAGDVSPWMTVLASS